MRTARFVMLLAATVVASGCLSATTLVRLQPDGSGTIEQTLAIRKDAAADLAQMMSAFGGQPGAAAKAPELFSEAEMRAAAAKLGEGVTFVSSRPITAGDRVGRTALYAFTDIRTLRIDQKPAAPGPAGMAGLAGGPAETVRFGFLRTPTGHSLLTVVFPESDTKAGSEGQQAVSKASGPGASKPTPEQIAMIRKMFDGLRIDMALEVDGTIVRTNGAYVSGNRVTLLEIDFGQLLTNDAVMQQMTEPKSIEEAKAVLKTVKGFKINLDRQLTVEFEGR